ncbi:hypothetical protein HHI36_014219 [Cryptolaemus montrouzieri]|uniref:DNA methyltransferase 2 n=1 Tax=Cryptolaemus montrouzieri TaxID=559131 RepID=A0ABD2N247_9CUCU
MKVLEFFSGIGGMHFALKESGIDGEVLLAADINPVANEVYKNNFPKVTLLNRNIESLSPEYLNKVGADTILMSPPCQPFTRNGLKGDTKDPRTTAFLHILNILPRLEISNILIENVKGFETSVVRNLLVETLEKCNFSFQEFLLNPTEFGIPNSRLRYYCVAKKVPNTFEFNTGSLLHHLPKERQELPCFQIKNIIESDVNDEYFLPKKILLKYWKLLDICGLESRRSCCFTKAYGRYAEGTGSVFTNISENEYKEILISLEQSENECQTEKLLENLKLRYFTPLEISRLQSFPNSFNFPSTLTDRQKYMLLGNSINIKVVSELIKLLK